MAGSKKIAFLKLLLLLLATIFCASCRDTASAASLFGSTFSSGDASLFGASVTASKKTTSWMESAVHQVNGVLYIHSNGQNVTFDADNFGGKDSFMWQAMTAMTKNGQQLTEESLRKLATAIVEKYLKHLDSWPALEAEFLTYGLSQKEIDSLQIKFENSNPFFVDGKAGSGLIQNLFDINLALAKGNQADTLKPTPSATSIVGKYDEKTKKFIFEPGSYREGVLIDRTTGKKITDQEMKENPLIYRRIYMGTTTGTEPVYIYADKIGIDTIEKTRFYLNNPLDKDLIKNRPYVSYTGIDGMVPTDINNCANFSQASQKMLETHGIEAYLIVLDGELLDGKKIYTYGHGAVGVVTGITLYPDNHAYKVITVFDAQTGDIMGVLGGPGTQISGSYDKYTGKPQTVENAIAVKDYYLTNGSAQQVYSTSPDIYTYTASRSITVDSKESLYVGGSSHMYAAGLAPLKSSFADDQQARANLIDNYASGLVNGSYSISFCPSGSPVCSVYDNKNEAGIKSASDVNNIIKENLDNDDSSSAVVVQVLNEDGSIIYNYDFNK